MRLPEDGRANLKKLVENDSAVDAIEEACRRYLFLAGKADDKTERKIVNDNLLRVHRLAEEMAAILEDKDTADHLSLLATGRPEFLRSPLLTRYGHSLRDLQKDLGTLAEITEGLQPLKRGRPSGSRNGPAWHLAYSLYLICEKAGLPARRITTATGAGSILHKICDELRGPLGLVRREFDGIIDELIKEVQKNE